MSEAAKQDIFVGVDLTHLKASIKAHDFSVTPKVYGNNTLKPSIETLLHALMPYPIVVHVHAVDILACLIRQSCETELDTLLDSSFKWTLVDYHKPGQALAAAINEALKKRPDSEIVFLKNHGVVISGTNVSAIDKLLKKLTAAFTLLNHNFTPTSLVTTARSFANYHLYSDIKVQNLALNEKLFSHLSSHWALYPDHVVFLGAHAHTYESQLELEENLSTGSKQPDLIFIRGQGVFTTAEFNLNKQAQLRCYYEILIRQHAQSGIRTLNHQEINELLSWDAEQYRLNLGNQA